MIIYLTKIEPKETKYTIESRFHDLVFEDVSRSYEHALHLAREQVKLINRFRRLD